MKTRNLIYDGTFDGLLSAIFMVFEERIKDVIIQPNTAGQNLLFVATENVITDTSKANRLWKGITKYLGNGSRQLYVAFLSEKNGIENLILEYTQHVFNFKSNISNDYANSSVLKISQIARSVGREKHRMEAFVRFRLTKDEIYFASIHPDFNVLPLIKKHFTNRYADQKWMIYDIARKYGLFYDLENTETIAMEFPKNFDFSNTDENYFAEQEFEFQDLWKNYFKSTNIASRKNMKLHTQHVPKRYWKYLSEKQP